MGGHIKEVLNGNGTALHINENDYVSIGKDGANVMIRAGSLLMCFDTWANLVRAIDCSKAIWSEGKEDLMMSTDITCADMIHDSNLQNIIDDVAKIGWNIKVLDCPNRGWVSAEFELKTPIDIDYSVIIDGNEVVVEKLFNTFANFYADDYVQNMCIYYANESMPCTITEALDNGRFIRDKLEALLRYFNGGEIDIKHHGDHAALALDETEKAHNEQHITICGKASPC